MENRERPAPPQEVVNRATSKENDEATELSPEMKAERDQFLEWLDGLAHGPFVIFRKEIKVPSISDEVMQSSEIQTAIEDTIYWFLEEYQVEMAETMAGLLRISEEQRKRLVEKHIKNTSWEDDESDHQHAVKTLTLSAELKAGVVKGIVIDFLKNGRLDAVFKMRRVFKISDEILESKEVRNAEIEIFKRALVEEDVVAMKDIAVFSKNGKNIESPLLQDTEVRQRVEDLLLRQLDRLSEGLVRSNILIEYIHISEELGFVASEVLSKPETKEKARLAAMKAFKSRQPEDGLKVINFFDLPREILQLPEVQDEVRLLLIKKLREKKIFELERIITNFEVPRGRLESTELQEIATNEMINSVEQGLVSEGLKIADAFGISDEFRQSFAEPRVQILLANNRIGQAANLADAFKLSREMQESFAQQSMITLLSSGEVDLAREVSTGFKISQEAEQAAAEAGIRKALSKTLYSGGLRAFDEFNISKEARMAIMVNVIADHFEKGGWNNHHAFSMAQVAEMTEAEIRAHGLYQLFEKYYVDQLYEGDAKKLTEITRQFGISEKNFLEEDAIQDRIQFMNDQSIPKYIREEYSVYGERISNHARRARVTWGLNPELAQTILNERPDLLLKDEEVKEIAEEDFDQVFDIFAESYEDSNEKAIDTLRGLKNAGCRAKDLLAFVNRPDFNFHDFFQDDALSSFIYNHKPVEARGNSKAHAKAEKEFHERFGKTILRQVAKDMSAYEMGNSYVEFKRICNELKGMWLNDDDDHQNGLPRNLDEIRVMTEELGIESLTLRAAKLSDEKYHPLYSWKGLKLAEELYRFLGRRELIAGLREAKPELQAFAMQLLESPVISVEAIGQFVKEPGEFLDREVGYGNEFSHSLAPARIAEVQRAGLTQEMLRDALFNGELDKMQMLLPFEQNYRMTKEGKLMEDLVVTTEFAGTEITRALGKRSEGMIGEAEDVKKLFTEVRSWIARHAKESDDGEVMTENGAAAVLRKWIKEGVAPNVSKEALVELLGDGTNGLLYRAKVGVRPLETNEVRVRVGAKSDPSIRVSGEAVANCMPFGDGKTNAYDWNPAISQLIVERKGSDGKWLAMSQSVLMIDHKLERLTSEVMEEIRSRKQLHEILQEKDVQSGFVLVADNIEPNKNELNEGRANLIELAMERFGRSYLRSLPEELAIDRTKFVIGKETYETGRPDWKFEKEANTYIPGSPVSYIDHAGDEVYKITYPENENTQPERSGVSEVTAADVLSMAFLEGKGFSENKGLIFGLADRYQRIMAGLFTKEHFGDPNLMLMVRNKQEIPQGYMLARVDHTNPELPEVYIDDMGVDRSKGLASGKYAVQLIDAFVEKYAEHYQDTEKEFPPIYAEMREETSYKLVAKRVEEFAKRSKSGLVVELVELGDAQIAGEKFHRVRIFIGESREKIEEQKRKYVN